MTEDRTKLQWGRLAATIRAAREALGLSQAALGEQAGVSEGTIQNLESGKPKSRMPQSLSKVEPPLGWASGSAVAVLKGGEPAPLPARDTSAGASAGQDELSRKFPLRVVAELKSDDPLLDSAVIELPGVGGARMTVVVHGQPDATPEEIQEALLAWRRAERKLRLPDDD
ncbi:multiprotein-bridging factor 1 family protein [Streptomyces sp. NPDC057596]|uniref:helix-turn-helix domain-containing protein n=1 Tax=Streptomyces sp. NPDC057596 TaxID=3346178 RepID=UPI0036C76E4A